MCPGTSVSLTPNLKRFEMLLPEGYLPRRGDVLVLHGTVKYDVVEKEDREHDGLKVFIRLDSDHSDRRVSLDTVVGIYSRKWEPGNLVRLIGERDEDVFEVVAVSGQHAWCKLEKPGCDPSFGTYLANDLEAAPEFVEPAAPPRASSSADGEDDDGAI